MAAPDSPAVRTPRNLFAEQAANRRMTWLLIAVFVLFLAFLGFGFDLFVLGYDGSRAIRQGRVPLPLAASVAAKFVRASIVPVENQSAPSGHPPTFGGSKSSWPMLASGARTVSSEKPCQPTSRIARATNSAGHE